MAYEVPGYVFSAPSSGDIVQFTGVSVGALGEVAEAAAGDPIDGVAQMPAVAGSHEVIRVMNKGITFALAEGIIPAGSEVEVGIAGGFIVLAAGEAVGKAMTDAGGADEIFSLLLY